MKTRQAARLASALVFGALLPAAAAATYDYDGTFTFCTQSCNGIAAWGGPGPSNNQVPSVIQGSIDIDVAPNSTFDTSALGEFQLQVFNPHWPVEEFDGSNPATANPLPVQAIVSGSGVSDASGAITDGSLVLLLTNPPFSDNDIVFYFDLADGSGEAFLFTNVVRFLEIQGEFMLRPQIDEDEDGVPDGEDNCLLVANPEQRDSNADGFGNLCDADLSNDCQTTTFDLALFRQVIFSGDPDADLDGDGIVNAIDLGLMRSLFFQPPGPSGRVDCP